MDYVWDNVFDWALESKWILIKNIYILLKRITYVFRKIRRRKLINIKWKTIW